MRPTILAATAILLTACAGGLERNAPEPAVYRLTTPAAPPAVVAEPSALAGAEAPSTPVAPERAEPAKAPPARTATAEAPAPVATTPKASYNFV